jgi:hypothetical protein
MRGYIRALPGDPRSMKTIGKRRRRRRWKMGKRLRLILERGANWNWATASDRSLAWRNMLVSAINAGLEQKYLLWESRKETRDPARRFRQATC